MAMAGDEERRVDHHPTPPPEGDGGAAGEEDEGKEPTGTGSPSPDRHEPGDDDDANDAAVMIATATYSDDADSPEEEEEEGGPAEATEEEMMMVVVATSPSGESTATSTSFHTAPSTEDTDDAEADPAEAEADPEEAASPPPSPLYTLAERDDDDDFHPDVDVDVNRNSLAQSESASSLSDGNGLLLTRTASECEEAALYNLGGGHGLTTDDDLILSEERQRQPRPREKVHVHVRQNRDFTAIPRRDSYDTTETSPTLGSSSAASNAIAGGAAATTAAILIAGEFDHHPDKVTKAVASQKTTKGVTTPPPAPPVTTRPSSMGSCLSQLRALNHKNLKSKTRSPYSTFFELFSPVAMCTILVVGYLLADVYSVGADTFAQITFNFPGIWGGLITSGVCALYGNSTLPMIRSLCGDGDDDTPGISNAFGSDADTLAQLGRARGSLDSILRSPLPIPTLDQFVVLSTVISRTMIDEREYLEILQRSDFGRQWGNLLTLGTLHLAPEGPIVEEFWEYLNDTYPLLVFNDTLRIRAHKSANEAMGYIEDTLATERAWALIDLSDAYARNITYTTFDRGDETLYEEHVGNDAKFTIRMNYTTLPNTNRIVDWSSVGLNNDYQRYYLSGFLTLQKVLQDFALARAEAITATFGSEADGDGGGEGVEGAMCQSPGQFELWSMPMPTPAYRQNDFYRAVGYLLGLAIAMGFLYPTSRLIKSIVEEKETRMKQTLQITGVRPGVYWFSWVLVGYAIFMLDAVLVSVTLKGSVLRYSSWGYVLLYLVLFCASIVSFSFFVAAFFSRAKLAAIMGPVALFATLMPRWIFYGSNRYENVGGKILASLLPCSAFAFGADIVAEYEYSEIGIQRDNASEGAYSFDTCLGMLLIDTVLYMVLGWYLDLVLPSQYGVARPFYFFLTPGYWVSYLPESWRCRCCRRVGGGGGDVETGMSGGGCLRCRRRNGGLDEDANSTGSPQARSPDNIEPALPGDVARVRILDLVKRYKRNAPNAVDHLSLDLYEDQITCLLGHNGAGKTTTISVLTGLFPPTSGDCVIYDHPVTTQLQAARQSMGICPQHNVLFPHLTVAEHLEVFERIKGIAPTREGVRRRAEDVGLGDKMQTLSGALSGGMKRKLSVAIALCGDPKFVLLDEPTSGMDPYSRRATWDLLRRSKDGGRVTLLTTHFMDEAEFLADRIAVMKTGKLQCSGSALFLKKRYGLGYTLSVVLDHQSTTSTPPRPSAGEPDASGSHDVHVDVEGGTRVGVGLHPPSSNEDMIGTTQDVQVESITSFLQRYVPDVKLIRRSARELTFRFPNGSQELFPALFGEFEKVREGLGIGGYGLANTSLEEVFLRLADNEEVEESQKKNGKAKEVSGEDQINCAISAVTGETEESRKNHSQLSVSSAQDVVESNSGEMNNGTKTQRQYMGRFGQTLTLLRKRMIVQRRDLKGGFFMVVLPALLIALVLLILMIEPPLAGPPIELSPNLYKSSPNGGTGTQVSVGGGAAIIEPSSDSSKAAAASIVKDAFREIEESLSVDYPFASLDLIPQAKSSLEMSTYMLQTYASTNHSVRFGSFLIDDEINLNLRVNWDAIKRMFGNGTVGSMMLDLLPQLLGTVEDDTTASHISEPGVVHTSPRERERVSTSDGGINARYLQDAVGIDGPSFFEQAKNIARTILPSDFCSDLVSSAYDALLQGNATIFVSFMQDSIEQLSLRDVASKVSSQVAFGDYLTPWTHGLDYYGDNEMPWWSVLHGNGSLSDLSLYHPAANTLMRVWESLLSNVTDDTTLLSSLLHSWWLPANQSVISSHILEGIIWTISATQNGSDINSILLDIVRAHSNLTADVWQTVMNNLLLEVNGTYLSTDLVAQIGPALSAGNISHHLPSVSSFVDGVFLNVTEGLPEPMVDFFLLHLNRSAINVDILEDFVSALSGGAGGSTNLSAFVSDLTPLIEDMFQNGTESIPGMMKMLSLQVNGSSISTDFWDDVVWLVSNGNSSSDDLSAYLSAHMPMVDGVFLNLTDDLLPLIDLFTFGGLDGNFSANYLLDIIDRVSTTWNESSLPDSLEELMPIVYATFPNLTYAWEQMNGTLHLEYLNGLSWAIANRNISAVSAILANAATLVDGALLPSEFTDSDFVQSLLQEFEAGNYSTILHKLTPLLTPGAAGWVSSNWNQSSGLMPTPFEELMPVIYATFPSLRNAVEQMNSSLDLEYLNGMSWAIATRNISLISTYLADAMTMVSSAPAVFTDSVFLQGILEELEAGNFSTILQELESFLPSAVVDFFDTMDGVDEMISDLLEMVQQGNASISKVLFGSVLVPLIVQVTGMDDIRFIDMLPSGTVTYQFPIDSATSIIHNSSSPHAVAAFNNAYMEYRYKRCTQDPEAQFTVVNHPLPLTAQQSIEIKTILSVFASLFILIPYCFVPAAFIVFLVKERVCMSKHVQLVSGVDLLAFWVAHYAWDLVMYAILTVLIMVVFLLYGKESAQVFVGTSTSSLCTLLLTFGYGVSALPFSYLLSRNFKNHSSAQIAVLGIFFVTGFVAVNAYFIMSSIEKTRVAAEWLRYLFRLWPPYNVGDGLIQLSQSFWQREIMGVDLNPFDWEVAGKPLALLYGLSVPYFLWLLFLEYSQDGGSGGLIGRLLRTVRRSVDRRMLRWHGVEKGPDGALLLDDGLDAEDEEDNDVFAERQNVREHKNVLKSTSAVLLSELWKVYPASKGVCSTIWGKAKKTVCSWCCCRKPQQDDHPDKSSLPKRAVRGLSTAVFSGETFGLLGMNGAGKSSTLAILTGDITPTSGEGFVAGYDITGEAQGGVEKARKHIGFCPQVDPLLDLMTGRETLLMFGRLRGIPKKLLHKSVDDLINALTLTPHADKPSESYSGGNKRKLSLGVALIGNPDVLFIDEASSGMDPAARRKMWELISEASKNRAVILTTHSMEEAEALCTRLTIMVKGRMRCLGSVQHLKSKYLDGYTLDLQLSGNATANVVEHVKQYILRTALPHASLVEQYSRFLRFSIPSRSSEGESWSGLGEVFAVLEGVKSDASLMVDDYALSQSTLEQVFISFAKAGESVGEEDQDAS